jgi:hypothetical protein
MKMISKILTFALSILIIGCNTTQKNNSAESDLADYLKSNWQTPEEYVINKFESHDYVFLGEYHRIKHDVDLILKLIPLLQENGINNLAIEFGNFEDQYLVDSLLNLPFFDRNLARQIIFNCSYFWGYAEYIDIYRVAWEVNHAKNASTKNRFRVVNLGAVYDPCQKGGAWLDIDPDIFMADVIFKEIISKNEKALIYSGSHHAFTKYHQPLYDFEKDTLVGFNKTRMGNVIYDSLKTKVFNIYLHAAWTSDKGWDENSVLPVNGVIDSIMTIFNNKPVGFDVINSPFGKLASNNSYYALGYQNFTLEQYCDGYIFQNSFTNYKPITMENNFITLENLPVVKKNMECFGSEKDYIDSLTVENANEFFFEDIRNHFIHLMKE